MEIYYVNGFFKHRNEALISVEDRGFNFSDGVYELISFANKNLIFLEKHFSRLSQSLKHLNIALPFKNSDSLKLIIKRLIKLNNLDDGYIYIQITRGTAKRNHIFTETIKPNITLFVLPVRKIEEYKKGVAVRTTQDLRWGRCDIKSVSLLPNILEKQIAHTEGFYESWQLKDKIITEGTTSNAFLVDKSGRIKTHPETNSILGGVTRSVILEIARKNKIKVIEKPFSLKDIKKCKEAFLTSTTVKILPVIKVDDIEINNKKVGPITKKLTDEMYRKLP